MYTISLCYLGRRGNVQKEKEAMECHNHLHPKGNLHLKRQKKREELLSSRYLNKILNSVCHLLEFFQSCIRHLHSLQTGIHTEVNYLSWSTSFIIASAFFSCQTIGCLNVLIVRIIPTQNAISENRGSNSLRSTTQK